MCLAWLTGNGDLHAKNISVLGSATGEWRVAPINDFPSALPYGDFTLALSVGGRREGLSRGRLMAFAQAVSLPGAAAERALDEVLRATATLIDDIAAGALPFDARRSRNLVRNLRQCRAAMAWA